MGVEWNNTAEVLPIAGREIVAKDPLKLTHDYSSGKQCQIMKFHHNFTKEQILDRMMCGGANFSLWSYTV